MASQQFSFVPAGRLVLVGAASLFVAGSGAYAFPHVEPHFLTAQFQVLEAEGNVSEEVAADNIVEIDSVNEVLPLTDEIDSGFSWSVEKTDAAVVVHGLVPSEQFQRFQSVRVPNLIDATRVGAGAPEEFIADALVALNILRHLETGRVAFTDGGWSVAGVLGEGQMPSDLLVTLDGARTALGDWTFALSAAEPVGTATEDVIASAEDAVPDEGGDETAVGAEVVTDENEVAPPPGAAADAYRFSALKAESGDLALSGYVPNEAVRSLLADLPGQRVEADDLSVSPGAPPNYFGMLMAGLAALDYLDEGQVAFADGNWLLSGRAQIDTVREAAVASLGRLSDIDRWRVMVTAPAARDVCEAEVSSFMEGRAVLFASGSATLADQSRELIPELAERLNICPQAVVYVEGHTDPVGGDAINLPLSVARAEAVVDALIAHGVSVNRLYAVGYGSSLPVATNETAAGREQNRRIVFTFEDTATHLEEGSQEP